MGKAAKPDRQILLVKSNASKTTASQIASVISSSGEL